MEQKSLELKRLKKLAREKLLGDRYGKYDYVEDLLDHQYLIKTKTRLIRDHISDLLQIPEEKINYDTFISWLRNYRKKAAKLNQVTTVPKNENKPEGPFGDHLGYYSLKHNFPLMHVHKVYAKKNAIWPFTVVGRPPQEDTAFGDLIHEITGDLISKEIPGLKELNAVDQNKAGIEGFKYKDQDSLEVWAKLLQNDEWAICFLNRSHNPIKVDFNWQDEMITDSIYNKTLNSKDNNYKIRNLWTKSNEGDTQKSLEAMLPSHGVIMLRL